MGTDFHMLLIRKKLGKSHSDTVHITPEKDMEERIVLIPEDFKNLLEGADLLDKFQSMAYTHRKEYIKWITEAKKQETQERRKHKAIEMIHERKKLS